MTTRRLFAATICLLLLFAGPALAGDDAVLDQGETALRHRRFDEALATYRKAREANPESVHAQLGYQEASKRAGKDSALASEFEKMWKKDATDPVAAFLYARLLPAPQALDVLSALPRKTFYVELETARALLQTGKPATDDLAAAATACPSNVRDLGLLAALYEDAAQFKDAKAIWAKAKELAPTRIAVLVGLGECQRRLGELDGALDCLQRAADLDRDDAEVFYRLGLVHFDRKEYQKGIDALGRATLITPRDVGPLMLMGECAMGLERYDDAEKRLRAALEIAPDRRDVQRRLAEVLELEDKNDDSLKLYRELLKGDPLDANARKGIGWIYIKKGKYEEAITELRQAADMDPSDSTPLFLIGYTYDLMGRWGEAVDVYEKLVKADPEHAWGWHNLGIDQAVLGDDAKAARSLKKAVDLDPDNAYFHLNYGYVLFDRKKYRNALEEFQAVVGKDAKSLPGQMGLALTYLMLKKYSDAVAAYEKAIELDPNNADLHLEAGVICQEDLKDDEKAVAHYEKYLLLGGIDPVVQAWVDELKKKLK